MIRIKITGRNPEYFIKKIIDKGIKYNNLVISLKEIYLDVSVSDYKDILNIKTSYKIEIVSYLGIYKYIVFIINYWYIFIFFILSIFYIKFLSNIIFDVEVIHSNEKIRNIIYSDLKDMGISKYKFKVSFLEKEKITSEILSKETNDIEWLEIEEVGSKYVVNVLQRKKNNDNDTCNYRHIVAKKDSMITSIFASSGEVVKKKYDYVKKGDILISGFIYNKELIKEKRCAEGVVLGEVWYKVLVFLPKQYYEEKVTGNKNIGVRVDFFNYSFSLFNKYDTYNIKSRNIVKNNLLPIGISLATYLETKSIVKEFDINNVDKEAFLIARDKLYSKLGKDISIKTQKVLKKEEKKSKILVEVFIKVEEDITDYFDITNINIDEINNSTKKE